MYFALFSFFTNPVLIAAYLMCVTTYSFALTNHLSINTASTYAIYCLILLKISSRFYSIRFFIQDIRNSNTTSTYIYIHICVLIWGNYIGCDGLNFLYFRLFKNIMGMNCLEIIKVLDFQKSSCMCFVRLHNHWGENRLYP